MSPINAPPLWGGPHGVTCLRTQVGVRRWRGRSASPSRGGEIVAEGTPEQVAANGKSYTGGYLKTLLAR